MHVPFLPHVCNSQSSTLRQDNSGDGKLNTPDSKHSTLNVFGALCSPPIVKPSRHSYSALSS